MLMSLMMFSLGIGVGYLWFHKPTPAPTAAPTPREAFEATEKLMSVCGQPYLSTDYLLELIRDGADVNARNNDGWTPLMLAAGHSTSPEIVTVLLEKGAAIESRDDFGLTPLLLAARSSHSKSPEIVRLLLDKGAEVNASNSYGITPLMFATNPEIIKILKAAGAK
jgi:ankyrin repeat protein